MRKRRAVKRDVLPDPIYKSKVVTKLVNALMIDGKKGKAQTILYDAFKMVEEKTGKPAMEVFNQALENIKPSLEVKSRRVGGLPFLPSFIIALTNLVTTFELYIGSGNTSLFIALLLRIYNFSFLNYLLFSFCTVFTTTLFTIFNTMSI